MYPRDYENIPEIIEITYAIKDGQEIFNQVCEKLLNLRKLPYFVDSSKVEFPALC